MNPPSDRTRTVLLPAAIMGALIAYAAGQPVMAVLTFVPLGAASIIMVPIQVAIAILAAWRLARIAHPLRRWAWGTLVAGMLFLLTIPCVLALANLGSADGSAAGTDAVLTALFFTLLIFGLPLLLVGGGLVITAVVLFRRAGRDRT